MSEQKKKRYPSEVRATVAKKIKAKQLGKKMFPEGFPAQLGEYGKRLKEFLDDYTGTDHEKTVWDEYYRISRVSDEDFAALESEAAAERLSVHELLAREIHQSLKTFVRIQGISCWVTNTTKGWAAELDVSEPAITAWSRNPQCDFIKKKKRGFYSIDIRHPFIRTEGWKKKKRK